MEELLSFRCAGLCTSPLCHRSIAANALYEWTSQNRQISASASSDGAAVAALDAFFRTSRPGSYDALAHVSYLGRRVIDWEGRVAAARGFAKASLDGKFESAFHSPVYVSGKEVLLTLSLFLSLSL